MRFLLYSHDGMGLGHVRRQLAIASAITASHHSAQVLLATSVDEVANLGLPQNVDTLKLPGLRKVANEQYASRRLALAASEIRSLRSALLRTTVQSFRPDVVLVDKHPLGAGGEFRSALEAARLSGARTALGMRDILDDAVAVLREWQGAGMPELIADYYDLVLVYGDRSVFDPIDQYQFPPQVAARTRFCGYVVHERAGSGESFQPRTSEARDQAGRIVLGTTGGGEDGFVLLRAFIEAAAGASWKAIAVAGPLLDEREYRILQNLAEKAGVTLHRFVPCLSGFFRVFDALVCMGGYNTLAEAVSTGIPTVCVPRVRPRSEQLLRSHAFERLGLLKTIHPDRLNVGELRRAIAIALDTPRQRLLGCSRDALNFEGTRRAARLLLELKPTKRRAERGQPRVIPAIGMAPVSLRVRNFQREVR